jgi:signal peptidase I
MDWLDFKEFIKDSMAYIITFMVVILIIVYIASLTQVVGPSMSKTLNDDDITVILKFQYKIFSPKRGDVVSFKYDETKYLIKRVIGLPGEHIEIIDSKIYIDEKEYEENYVLDDNNKNIVNHDYGIVPENSYFMLGDNRDNSLDSRTARVGFIDKKDFIGKVVFRLFPFQDVKFVN